MALLLFSYCHWLPCISILVSFSIPPKIHTRKHTPVLSIANEHQRTSHLTGNIWVNWNFLFFHRLSSQFPVCHPAPPPASALFLSLPPAKIAPSPWTMHKLARSAMHFTETWSFTPMSECAGRQRGNRGADVDTWRRGTCLMIEGCFNLSVGWKLVRLAERLAAKHDSACRLLSECEALQGGR